MNRKISVIHPTRGRYRKAKEVFNQVTKLAIQPDKLEYLLSVDEDEGVKYDFGKVIKHDNHTAIEAINYAATKAKGDILIVVSDDFSLPYGWDDQIREATKGKTNWLLKVFDGIQEWLVTIPIMDREYYESFGYVYHPGYKHLFCDTELAAVGDLTKKTITRLDIVFNHNHYSICGGKDKINEKNDKTFKQGEELYIERYKRNFDLKENTGNIKDRGHSIWISQKLKGFTSKQWSILILTMTTRRNSFNKIYGILKKQIERAGLTDTVEILVNCDDGKKSIGQKRTELLAMAKGKYINFVDDDDDVSDHYVNSIFKAIQEDKDCVEFRGMYYKDGKEIKPFYHSIYYKEYAEDNNGYYRPPNHLNPIKKDIAINYAFKEVNMGEDTDWAMRMANDRVLRTEAKNNSIVYLYKYISGK